MEGNVKEEVEGSRGMLEKRWINNKDKEEVSKKKTVGVHWVTSELLTIWTNK